MSVYLGEGGSRRRGVTRRLPGVISLLMGVVVSATLGLGSLGDPVVSAANTLAPQTNVVEPASDSPITAQSAIPAWTNTGVTTVSAGWGHTCAIQGSPGVLFCWGANFSAQLGIGSDVAQSSPVPVSTSAAPGFENSGVTDVSAGGEYTCAVEGGEVFCWGKKAVGVLGDGISGGTQSRPIKVPDNPSFPGWNSGISRVFAASQHTCALKGATSELYCWGLNNAGQLGIGSINNPTTYFKATKVSDGAMANSGVTGVAMSSATTCALREGTLYCWGSTNYGLALTGTNTGTGPSVSALALASSMVNSSVDSIDGGTVQFCAVKSNLVYCWGHNGTRAVGVATAGDITEPTLVQDGEMVNSNVTQVSTGIDSSTAFTCALKQAKVFCWGSNSDKQLGNNSAPNPQSTPVAVGDGEMTTNGNVSSIDAGGSHACAIKLTVVYCWGDQTYGQLGNKVVSPNNQALPVQVFAPPSLTPSAQTVSGVVGTAVTSSAFAATGFSGQMTYAVTSGSLPTGVTISASTGVISGTPTATSSATVTITGTGTASGTSTASITFSIMDMARTPTFDSPVATATGFTVNVTNHDVAWTWTPTVSAGSVSAGAASGSTLPLTVTGLSAGGTATVTVSATRAGYANGSGVVVGATLGPPSSNPPSDPPVFLPAPPSPAPTPNTPSNPNAPTPEGPAPVAPPTPGQAPSLISGDDAPQLEQQPGQGGAIVGGSPVSGEVETIESPAASVPPSERSPEQVQELQQAAARLIEAFNESLPANGGPLVTITNTETGAVLNGLLVDPRDGVTPIAIPVENLVVMTIGDSKVLLVGASPSGQPLGLVDGVLQVGPGGVLSIVLSGLPANAKGEAVLFSNPILLGAFTTTKDGSFAGQFAVPSNVVRGAHTLVLAVNDTKISIGVQATAPMSLLPPGRLPVTGDGRSETLVLTGMWLLVFGTLAGAARRRRWLS